MARVVALPQLALLLMTAGGPVAQTNPGSSPAASSRATTVLASSQARVRNRLSRTRPTCREAKVDPIDTARCRLETTPSQRDITLCNANCLADGGSSNGTDFCRPATSQP